MINHRCRTDLLTRVQEGASISTPPKLHQTYLTTGSRNVSPSPSAASSHRTKEVNTPNQPAILPMFKSSTIRTTRERTTSLVVVTTTHLLTRTPTLVENAAALTARTDEAGLSQTEPRRETQPAARKKKEDGYSLCCVALTSRARDMQRSMRKKRPKQYLRLFRHV